MLTNCACFIHSTHLELQKDQVLMHLLDTLKTSGLLKELRYLCIINTGLPLNVKRIESEYVPAKVIQYSSNTLEFENVSIRALYTFAKLNPGYKILYLHTKGVSYHPTHVFYPGVQSWNNYMMHCLIERFTQCLSLLQIYDTVGCNYRKEENGNPPHYSGNFWWANASYLQTLSIDYLKDKYDPEFWLLQNDPLWFNVYTLEHMYEQAYPLDDYKSDVKYSLEDNIFFCKVGFCKTGLCNQLYSIANVVSIAAAQHGDGNKLIILDDFMTDIDMFTFRPSDEILDIQRCNNNVLLSKNQIHLIHKDDITMTLDKVEYGLNHIRVLDITEHIRKYFWTFNHLYVPQGTHLNEIIKEDPCPQMRKHIRVFYSINGIPFQKVFHERLLLDSYSIEIKHSNYDGKKCSYLLDDSQPWLTRINRNDSRQNIHVFNHFLKTVSFQKEYYEIAEYFFQCVCHQHESESEAKANVNILHIRNESDAIEHWSKINQMTKERFQEEYERQYIECVTRHLSKNDIHIALTAFTDENPIIESLRLSGYKIYCRSSSNKQREINAIIDLIIGSSYGNSVFIGNMNPETFQGSTFSYVLCQQMEPMVKKLVLNIENILLPPTFL